MDPRIKYKKLLFRVIQLGEYYYIQRRKHIFAKWKMDRLLGGQRYALCSVNECKPFE